MSNDKVADELAIRNRYSAYTFAVDYHDPDGFVDCFTANAEIEVSSFEFARQMAASGAAPFINANGWVIGSKNIRLLNIMVPDTVLSLHLTSNIQITKLEGDVAEGRAAFAVFAEDGVMEHYGRYDDRLERGADGKWRFAVRRVIARYERQRKAFNIEQ